MTIPKYLKYAYMSDHNLLLISNKQLREQSYSIPDDRYGMASLMNNHVKRTMLSSPNAEDDKIVLVLALRDQIVVGRALQLGARLKLGEKLVPASAEGGRVEVVADYRGKGVGSSIIKWRMVNNEYDFIIGALYSTKMVSILKKQGFIIFEKPLYVQIRSFEPKLKSMGMKGILLSVCTNIVNTPLRIIDLINRIKLARLKKSFVVKKESIIPQWAGEMATNDGHKYQEVHDRDWLQWNLDYNLNGYPQDVQSYYSIYDKNTGEPCGFFLTKERYEEEAGPYKDVVKGTVCEWAYNTSTLCEADIHLLAISTFSSNVFYINAISVESDSIKKFKSMGFVRHGNFQMSFLDKKNQLESDISNPDNWRIRYGCANSIIC